MVTNQIPMVIRIVLDCVCGSCGNFELLLRASVGLLNLVVLSELIQLGMRG